MTIYEETIEHELNISQDTQEQSDYEPTIEHLLVVYQDISVYVESESGVDKVDSTLEIEQDVSAAGSIFSRTIEHTLEIIQEILNSGTLAITIEDILDITQTITHEYVESLYDSPGHFVEIEQDVLHSCVYNRTVEHTLTITSNVNGWKI